MGAIKILLLFWLSLYSGFYMGRDELIGAFLGLAAIVMLAGVANDHFNRD